MPLLGMEIKSDFVVLEEIVNAGRRLGYTSLRHNQVLAVKSLVNGK